MNMICRSLVPLVAPKVRSTEVSLTSRNTLSILKTIKPVAKVFTAIDKAKLVMITGSKGGLLMKGAIPKIELNPMHPSDHLATHILYL